MPRGGLISGARAGSCDETGTSPPAVAVVVAEGAAVAATTESDRLAGWLVEHATHTATNNTGLVFFIEPRAGKPRWARPCAGEQKTILRRDAVAGYRTNRRRADAFPHRPFVCIADGPPPLQHPSAHPRPTGAERRSPFQMHRQLT